MGPVATKAMKGYSDEDLRQSIDEFKVSIFLSFYLFYIHRSIVYSIKKKKKFKGKYRSNQINIHHKKLSKLITKKRGERKQMKS